MKRQRWQDLEKRYDRFIRDIAFVFLFDVLSAVLIVVSFFVPYYGMFLILATLGAACAGMAIAQKLIILHRIYRGTKWRKE